MAALRFGALLASRGDLVRSQGLFKWIFDEGRKSADVPLKQSGLLLASGLTASGLSFLSQDRRAGNRMMRKAVHWTATTDGKDSPLTQKLAYFQASLLFLQRESQDSMAVLRSIFERCTRSLGKRHKKTEAAGELLAIGLIADSVVSKVPISAEVDRINDELVAQRGGMTVVTHACMAMAIFFTNNHLGGLATPLLRWIYKSQTRNFGRFSRESLLVLAVIHALNVWKMYRKMKKIPSDEGTDRDPRVFLPKLWDTVIIPGMAAVVHRLTTEEKRSRFLSVNLPQSFAKTLLWNSFEKRFPRDWIMQFTPFPELAQMQAAWVGKQPPEADAASQVWTVHSDASTSRIYKDHMSDQDCNDSDNNDDDKSSFNLSELLGPQGSEHLGSFGASLLDLASLSEGEIQRAEENMGDLQNKLVSELVGEEDVDAARSNVDVFEREFDLD